MAKEKDTRKGFWDDDEEDSQKSSTSTGITKTGTKSNSISQRTGSLGFQDSADIDHKIHENKMLMEQTHQLYQQYFSGVEKRPPIEKVRLLESKIKELERVSATSTTSRFKLSQFILQYKTFKDLWDRKLRDQEKK